jgi:hypothetical protein
MQNSTGSEDSFDKIVRSESAHIFYDPHHFGASYGMFPLRRFILRQIPNRKLYHCAKRILKRIFVHIETVVVVLCAASEKGFSRLFYSYTYRRTNSNIRVSETNVRLFGQPRTPKYESVS